MLLACGALRCRGECAMTTTPTIGIVGSLGAYGRWLTTFFRERMGLRVLGCDPADTASPSVVAMLDTCDVLVFAVPIRVTPEVIAGYVQAANGREQRQLWLDVTSIKSVPVAAMLASRARSSVSVVPSALALPRLCHCLNRV